MQKEELGKESLTLIKSIDEALTRLYKLNQGLLLISKIDNLYFKDERDVSLKSILESNILNYKEIMQLKNINVEIDGDDPATVRMSELLAEVLISNLISNAVRYNINGGFIKCQIKRGTLTISNSGMPLKSDPENLFRRFSKESDSPQSVGLGLSIVRKIVGEYNMKITYSYDKNVHELRLNF
jgi:signal transduction histidine kinase